MKGIADAMTAARDFDAVYRCDHARLVGELFALTGDIGDAEDIVQEAFARAYGRWSHVSSLEQPAAWVRRVAMNLAVSRWRQVRTRGFVWRSSERHEVALPADPAVVDLVRELDRLPVHLRRTLVLHHVVGLSVREIADFLEMPEGSVKSQLSRTRSALRERLAVQDES